MLLRAVGNAAQMPAAWAATAAVSALHPLHPLRRPLRPRPRPATLRTALPLLISSMACVPAPVQRWMSSAAALAQPLQDLPPYASNVSVVECYKFDPKPSDLTMSRFCGAPFPAVSRSLCAAATAAADNDDWPAAGWPIWLWLTLSVQHKWERVEAAKAQALQGGGEGLSAMSSRSAMSC